MAFEKLKALINKRIEFEKNHQFYPYDKHTFVFALSNAELGPNEIAVALEKDGSLSYQVINPKDPKKAVICTSIKSFELRTQLGNRYDEFLYALKEKNLSQLNQFWETILTIASKKYFNPYREYPTDLNFCDIHGKALLHYAAEEGRFNEVKRLISEGANVNLKMIEFGDAAKSPILLALEAGHLEISQYLYRQGADCSKLELEKVTDSRCREWLCRMIKKEIDACCEFLETPPFLDINTKISSRTQFFIHTGFESSNGILFRMIEIGELNYVRSYKNAIDDPELDDTKALCLAAANGHLEIVNFLLDEASVHVDPTKPYVANALQAAISANQLDMAKYLVSRGADINLQDNKKYNALMIAVKCKNKIAVEWLLDEKINLHQTDMHGNHVLHLAIESGDKSILNSLLENPEIKSKLIEENIYGQTALDIAALKNDAKIIAMLSSIIGKELPTRSSEDIKISQTGLIKNKFYYLRIRYRDAKNFPIQGECNGHSYEHSHYQDKEDHLFDTLALLKQWNGNEEDLYLPFPKTMPQTKYYKNLDELFDQKINDTLWFQHSAWDNNREKQATFPSYEQHDRVKQYAVIGKEEKDAPHLLSIYNHPCNPDQIREILLYFSKMPTGTRLEISCGSHSTSAHINSKHEIVYRDPNFHYRTKPLKEVNVWLEIMINFMYIGLKNYPSNLNKFTIQFYFFVASKNLHRFNQNFHLFSPENYSRPIVESFQSQSPNQFTPLHLAVTTRSLTSVKKLLMDGYCQVNAKDRNGNTVLYLAIKFDFKEAVDLLLEHPSIDVMDKNIFNLLDKKRVKTHISPSLLDYLSYAIIENKTSLTKVIIKRIKKEKINIDAGNTDSDPPLSIAIQSKSDELVKELLLNGAKWTTVCKNEFDCRVSRSAIDLVITKGEHHYPLMIQTLPDINKKDDHGKAAIHYAAQYGKISLIKDLIDKGSDIHLKSEAGYTPLDFVINEWVKKNSPDVETVVALTKTITEDKNFNTSREPVSSFYQLLDYSTKKNIPVAFNVNLQSNVTGNTLLHHRIKNYTPDKKQDVEVLLRNGANLDIKNKEGKTAYELACDSKNDELLGIFNTYKEVVSFKPLFSEAQKSSTSENNITQVPSNSLKLLHT